MEAKFYYIPVCIDIEMMAGDIKMYHLIQVQMNQKLISIKLNVRFAVDIDNNACSDLH